MFLGFINTEIGKKHNLLSLSNLSFFYYFTNLSLFWGNMYPPPFFGE